MVIKKVAKDGGGLHAAMQTLKFSEKLGSGFSSVVKSPGPIHCLFASPFFFFWFSSLFGFLYLFCPFFSL